jgi:ribosomal protein L37AE/L43A
MQGARIGFTTRRKMFCTECGKECATLDDKNGLYKCTECDTIFAYNGWAHPAYYELIHASEFQAWLLIHG